MTASYALLDLDYQNDERIEVWASGFESLIGYSSGDSGYCAYLYDSAGNDTFTAAPTYAYLSGSNYLNRVEGFQKVYTFATAWTTRPLGTIRPATTHSRPHQPTRISRAAPS